MNDSPMFRPPAEAYSLILRVAQGCPWNKCTFCAMYKRVKYRERDLDEVLDEIPEVARMAPTARRIFLADGDVMHLPFETLERILVQLNEWFPRLNRVNVYANGSSILAKTPEQLKQLRELKMNTLYVGLETGDDDLLKRVRKGETADGMIDAVKLAQDCGFRCSVMALLGLAGKNGSVEHAARTAEALNRMQPRLLSLLRFIEVSDTRTFDGYEGLTEREAVLELRSILDQLALNGTVFTANHASNPVPLKGRLPTDRERLLAEVDAMLASGLLDDAGPGHVPMWL